MSPTVTVVLPPGQHGSRRAGSGRKKHNKEEKGKGKKKDGDRGVPKRRYVPDEPQHDEPPFEPRPGDVIVRCLPPTPLSTQMVLRVMGVIRNYKDDYYFVYDEFGQTHLVRFTFRNRDRILRVGRFTSKIYSWKFDEFATLYIYWQMAPDSPGEWHKVAQQHNANPYRSHTHDELFFDRPGHVTDEGMFRVMEGDFVIHSLPAVAHDRPWGQAFELRIIPPEPPGLPEERNFDAGDVVVRVRLAIPKGLDVIENMPDGVIDLVACLVDDHVPMYVVGFLCLGTYAAGNRRVPTGRWRYLGYDQHIFRDYRSLRWEQSRWLESYQACPVQPGDIIVNLDEVIHDPCRAKETVSKFHQGHILIYGDKDYMLDKPEELAGSMIVRFGSFFSEDGWKASEDIHYRTRWVREFEGQQDENERYRLGHYACWAEQITPKLIIHDSLSKDGTGWVEANLLRSTSFEAPEQINLEEPRDNTPFGIGFEPHRTPLYHQVEGLRWEEGRDFILRAEVPDIDMRNLLTTPQSQVSQHDGKITLQNIDEENRRHCRAIAGENQYHAAVPNMIDHIPDRKFSLVAYTSQNPIRDGDHIIRFKVENCVTAGICWVLSAELYACSRLQPECAANPRASLIYAFKGRDQIILPNPFASGGGTQDRRPWLPIWQGDDRAC